MKNKLWAKLEKADEDYPGRPWLSLVDHSADVAAVFEAMLQVPLVARRLAALAGERELPSPWRQRLCVHVALHDFGKANRGFQARRNPKAPLVGHVAPGLALLYARDAPALSQRLADTLMASELFKWGSFEAAFRAVAAHHGRPVTQQVIEHDWRSKLNSLWAPADDYDPIAALEPLSRAIRSCYPDAFAAGGPPLPDAPSFWHAVSGFVMLADWIGSDARQFPLYIEPTGDRMADARAKALGLLVDYGFDPGPKRRVLPAVSFTSISAYPPRPIQEAAGKADGQVVILEAETGSGKTEAALYRFARLFETGEVDGLYFALPTRVAAKSLEKRVRDAVERLFPQEPRPAVLLAVPGYAKVDGIAGRPLPEFRVLWDDDSEGGGKRQRWAAEHPKRFLAGTIAVGTVDQALLGAIQTRHAHMRSSSLLRHLLVVDEVHSSDVYMERLLTSLLEQHIHSGGQALLLSATLGAAARGRLLGNGDGATIPLTEAQALPYPAVSTSLDRTPRRHAGSSRVKEVQLDLDPRIADAEAIAGTALAAAARGAKVLVIRNTRTNAVETARALMSIAPDHPALFRCNEVPTLHHGRFAREDRELLDGIIEKQMEDGRGQRGLVLIGTQTLEQSLDICADFMITDLCPADVLLQRLGRLHRHAKNDGHRPDGFGQPRAIVLSPRDLSSLLLRGQYGLGGEYGPYRDLVMLEATRRLIAKHGTWKIPAMNRLLVEQVTHPDALETLTAELEAVAPAWRAHRLSIEGNTVGNSQIAIHARLDWSKSFYDDTLAFPEGERIATRLGAQDLAVILPAGTIGPFGAAIEAISIPDFWARGIDRTGDVEPVITEQNAEQITFHIQGRQFTYDRFGLEHGTART